MITIFLAILFTTLMFICFKYFHRFNINTFHAILVNYFVAAAISYYFTDNSFEIDLGASWVKVSAVMGLMFILAFVVTSITAQKVSLIVSMISSKMSLVIPLTYAIIFVGEEMTWIKAIAIVLAMVGVVLTILQGEQKRPSTLSKKKSLLLIVAVFLGSGLVDTSFKHVETNFYALVPQNFIMMICYASAALFAVIYFAFSRIKGPITFSYRAIPAGIILGSFNYFSFHFVLEALHYNGLPSTIVFPIVNVGVLLLSALAAVLLFHERLRLINYVGVAISILSIVLLALQ